MGRSKGRQQPKREDVKHVKKQQPRGLLRDSLEFNKEDFKQRFMMPQAVLRS